VKVGQELIDIVSLDDVWITANFTQSQLVHLKLGQPVEIKVDAYGRAWKGHVTNLGAAASSALGGILPSTNQVPRVPVRIDFDRPENQTFNAEDLLKPGLSVEPKVRVRWLPRTGSPSTSQDGRGFSAEPTARWHRLLLTTARRVPAPASWHGASALVTRSLVKSLHLL
jgi:hypothetical protein